MRKFSEKEIEFLNSMEECRIATSHDNLPHVKPVSYIFENGKFLIATDYGTRMYENCKVNPRVALTVDVYSHGGHKAILVQGTVKIIENGKEFLRIFKKFHDKFEWVKDEPWDENEAPFIVITPFSKTSWGLE
jgi:nitroimidazol reductase NimA-like FMN-containing flavoprotein (pyridoxamine 5'-phosphate oxidase superfamily)